MALELASLKAFGTGAALKTAGARTNRIWHYASNDDWSTISAAGYFNNARAYIGVGDIVFISADLDGSPVLRIGMFTAVPGSGNVTFAQVTTG